MTASLEEFGFGHFAPNPPREIFRRFGRMLPANYWGRRAASLLLGPAGGRARRPRDVVVFDTQCARLHPYDNICEKRVYLTPQIWDAQERNLLRAAIKRHPKGVFYFVDVGANAGLYTLFARASAHRAGKHISAACIEPDSEMRMRMSVNFKASKALDDVRIYPYAVANERGPVSFSVNKQSRGMSRLSEDNRSTAVTVQGAPLADIILGETDLPRIDAMKIDIEGHEHRALTRFFADAPTSLYPGLIIAETSHQAPGANVDDLISAYGYEQVLHNRLNTVFVRQNNPYL